MLLRRLLIYIVPESFSLTVNIWLPPTKLYSIFQRWTLQMALAMASPRPLPLVPDVEANRWNC